MYNFMLLSLYCLEITLAAIDARVMDLMHDTPLYQVKISLALNDFSPGGVRDMCNTTNCEVFHVMS